jgi:hypothetical protein
MFETDPNQDEESSSGEANTPESLPPVQADDQRPGSPHFLLMVQAGDRQWRILIPE